MSPDLSNFALADCRAFFRCEFSVLGLAVPASAEATGALGLGFGLLVLTLARLECFHPLDHQAECKVAVRQMLDQWFVEWIALHLHEQFVILAFSITKEVEGLDRVLVTLRRSSIHFCLAGASLRRTLRAFERILRRSALV